LFDVQLARHLSEVGDDLNLHDCAAALNRVVF
jgi:hypothetical protein